jgi:hypothetical protein
MPIKLSDPQKACSHALVMFLPTSLPIVYVVAPDCMKETGITAIIAFAFLNAGAANGEAGLV